MGVYIENFQTVFGVKNNIQFLRNKVIELAIQGKLIEQDPHDEPASELLQKIQIEKEKLVMKGKIKRQKQLLPITQDEIPFEIPGSWEWVKLIDVNVDIADVDHKMPAEIEDGIPYISPKDFFGSNGINFEKSKKISKEDFDILSKKIQPEYHDIIFPRYGTIGVVRYVETDIDFLVSYSCATIKTFKEIMSPKYILYYLQSQQTKKEIDRYINKTTQPNVGLISIKQFVFPLPPLNEQHCIVQKVESIMSSIDQIEESLRKKEYLMEQLPKAVVDSIAKCQKGEELKEQLQFVIENFETIFQTPDSMQELRNVVLQLAIEGKLVPQDTADEPASELVKRIKVEKNRLVKEGKIKKQKLLEPIEADEISFEIPDSWKWVRLGTIISFQGGYAYKSNSYIEKSHYQIIRLGNVKNDRILINTSPVYIPNNIAFETMNYKISVGDILVTMTGTKNKRDYFYTCRVCEEDLRSKELFLNQRVGNLKSDKEINSYYINLMLKAESILKSIFATETGTANQGNIGSGSIENLIIPLPPVNEQYRIVKKVESIMNLIDQMEAELKRKINLVEKMANV